MPYSLLSKVVHALSQEPLVAARLVSPRLYPNSLTQNVLSMSDVEKEEMRWQKYFRNSQNFPLTLKERNTILCRELA